MLPVAPVQRKPQIEKSRHSRQSVKRDDLGSVKHNSSGLIQVLVHRDHVILRDGGRSLWCSREDGIMLPSNNIDMEVLNNPRRLGECYGLIGKIRFFPDSEWNILLIEKAKKIGNLPPSNSIIYCIERVSLLPLTMKKSVEELKIESYLHDRREKEKEMKERDKLERRLTEALLNMFNGSQSFYFSYDIDLTQSIQRQQNSGDSDRLRPCHRVDERFFWNKHMISELIEFGPAADPWILPIIQGSIEIFKVPIPSRDNLGIFKKYTPRRRSRRSTARDIPSDHSVKDYSSLESSTSTMVDVSSYAVVEKQGDKYISRSYSPTLDEPFNKSNNEVTNTPPQLIELDEVLMNENLIELSQSPKDTSKYDYDNQKELVNKTCDTETIKSVDQVSENDETKIISTSENLSENLDINNGIEYDNETSLLPDINYIATTPTQLSHDITPHLLDHVDPMESDVILKHSDILKSSPLLIPKRMTENYDSPDTPPSMHHSPVIPHQSRDTSPINGSPDTPPSKHHSPVIPRQSHDISPINGSPDTPSSKHHSPVIPHQSHDISPINGSPDTPPSKHHSPVIPRQSHDISPINDSSDTPSSKHHSPNILRQSSPIIESDTPPSKHHSPVILRQSHDTSPINDSSDTPPSKHHSPNIPRQSHDTSPINDSSDTLPSKRHSPVIPHQSHDSSPINYSPDTARNKHHSPSKKQWSCDSSFYNGSITSIDSDDFANTRYEDLPIDVLTDKEKEKESEKESEKEKEVFDDSQLFDGWTKELELSEDGIPLMTMALLSRRSRYRAGTRYLRRGVDGDGHVANYVETELILQIDSHVLSFVIARGSVPVYWTQPGHKYRPLPIIQKTDSETAKAFESHFEMQINLYSEQVLVNLINQSGRERIVGGAYEKHLLMLDCPSLTYVAFDFHHHCKANQWHNINNLLDNIEEYINRQKFFWYDVNYKKDVLCEQKGVFRVNCIDCLDRTNVVQSVIAREVIQTVLQKLGLISPFDPIYGQFLRQYQEMWANHGDTISRQYTGTAAMKGDLTRYGQRRLYGVMRDGYNSAHRYIQSVFRDAYRQVVIDIQQGALHSEALSSLPESHRGGEEVESLFRPPSFLSDLPSWSTDREEAIADIIKTCRDELYPNVNVPVKGWVLLEAPGYSFITGSEKEEETVLLLCKERRHICIANYSPDFDHVACCIRIPLERIDRIVVGQIGTILYSSPRLHMRLYYTLFPGHSCYFTFRTVHSLSIEEDKLNLLSIAQEIYSLQPNIPIQEQRLSKKHSRPHEGVVYLIAPGEWMSQDNEEDSTVQSQSVFYDDPVSSPIEDLSGDCPSGSDSNISYTPLTSKDSTSSCNIHSRHSSTGSALIALINEDLSQSGYESDSSDENEAEISMSAPSSPILCRRTSIISLEERCRLLSHSSCDDLTHFGEENQQKEKHNEGEVAILKRDRSFGFRNVETTSDSEDNEVLHHIRMNSVLSTPRHSYTQKSTQRARSHDRDVKSHHPHKTSHDHTNVTQSSLLNITHKSDNPTTNDDIILHHETMRSLKDRVTKHKSELTAFAISDIQATPTQSRIHSYSVPVKPNIQSDSSDMTLSDRVVGGATSSSGWYLSRLKGKLFGKSRGGTSETQPDSDTMSQETSGRPVSNVIGDVKFNVFQTIGRLKNIGGKEGKDSEKEKEAEEEEEMWMKEAMKNSKTRFIII